MRDIQTQVVLLSSIVVDPRFQPRDESGVSPQQLERMKAAGRKGGHANGWAPELYDPIRVAILDRKTYVGK